MASPGDRSALQGAPEFLPSARAHGPDNGAGRARHGSSLGPLGILGGGQLARMTIQAAADLGVETVVAERFPHSPAAQLSPRGVLFPAGWDDAPALARLAQEAPLVTLENEFIDATHLAHLEELGSRVVPSPDTLAVVQDKLRQKEVLERSGLPVVPYRAVNHPGDLARAGAELGWPLVLKARRGSYDGYGNAVVPGPKEAEPACSALGWPERSLYAEAFVTFERELAIILVRGRHGETASYPVAESRQDPVRHVCEVVLAPAPVPWEAQERAANLARRAVEAVNGQGVFGVELFLLPDGAVWINELAPRPHNTGHYTIQACATSQFANHVRAVLGLPLGETALRVPAAAMVNLLGIPVPPSPERLAAALSVRGTYLHLYGKRESRPGRKMGHVTALAASVDEALARAQEAAGHLAA